MANQRLSRLRDHLDGTGGGGMAGQQVRVWSATRGELECGGVGVCHPPCGGRWKGGIEPQGTACSARIDPVATM